MIRGSSMLFLKDESFIDSSFFDGFWRCICHRVASPCKNLGEMVTNPAAFCDNPAERVINPAVFSHNPASFANNPADSGNNPAVLLIFQNTTLTLIPTHCRSSFGHILCCSNRVYTCIPNQESHVPTLNKRWRPNSLML